MYSSTNSPINCRIEYATKWTCTTKCCSTRLDIHALMLCGSSYTFVWALACNDANAIPTQSRYAGAYAVVIAGLYGWEGLEGLGLGCKWLAGLVWEGLEDQGLGCVGFVYKIVKITAASSINGGGQVLWLMCVEQRVQILVYTLTFFPVKFFLSFGSSHLR